MVSIGKFVVKIYKKIPYEDRKEVMLVGSIVIQELAEEDKKREAKDIDGLVLTRKTLKYFPDKSVDYSKLKSLKQIKHDGGLYDFSCIEDFSEGKRKAIKELTGYYPEEFFTNKDCYTVVRGIKYLKLRILLLLRFGRMTAKAVADITVFNYKNTKDPIILPDLSEKKEIECRVGGIVWKVEKKKWMKSVNWKIKKLYRRKDIKFTIG